MNLQQALEHASGMTVSESSTATEKALQTLAAEVRRLTELRPMSEAPCDKDILIELPNGSMAVEYGDDYKYQRAIGWLPLPKVTE